MGDRDSGRDHQKHDPSRKRGAPHTAPPAEAASPEEPRVPAGEELGEIGPLEREGMPATENDLGPPEEVPRAAGEDSDRAAGAAARIATLEERVAALEEERRRLEDLWLRARADLENFRRRALREEEERERRATERILLPVLEVLDNLEKALATIREGGAEVSDQSREASLVRGIELIHQQLAGLLAGEGVSPISAVGQGFDPQLHEAVHQIESPDHESHTVVEEYRRGYLLRDRLLRPARVVVAK